MILSTPVNAVTLPSGGSLPSGTVIPSYLYISVAPNPVGVGQTVIVNCFLGATLIDGEAPVNMSVQMTAPNGNTQTRSLSTDQTGGGYFNFVPDTVGTYKFQGFYGGQDYAIPAYVGLKEGPSQTSVATLTVQQEPVTQSTYPFTPLPTNWWETPVSAQNTQYWYQIMGPDMFPAKYNTTSSCNPYTQSVLSGHVLWTKPWGTGGVVGGDAGPSETTGQYWTARQYKNQFSPIIISGKLYAQYYPETTSYQNGVVCVDLYSGQTLFTINTTSTLLCGMVSQYQTLNDYGVIGPYIITTGSIPAAETGGIFVYSKGTQFNMYSATTGKYVMSIVNGTSLSGLHADTSGNLIGYYTNSTVGTMTLWNPSSWNSMPPPPMGPAQGPQYPTLKSTVNITAGNPLLCMFNLTQALWDVPGNNWEWGPAVNTVIDFRLGVMWTAPVPTMVNGALISPSLGINMYTGNEIMLTSMLWPVFFVQNGWEVLAAMNAETGALKWVKNFTYPEFEALQPFTRFTNGGMYCNGNYMWYNLHNNVINAIDCATGNLAWKSSVKTPYGDGQPNYYDELAASIPSNLNSNGRFVIMGFGGDIWCINATTGSTIWYTNTTTLLGPSGLETPFNIWPLWTFGGTQCMSNDVLYVGDGHAYNPPMFHGAQLLAINMTNGQLIWSELDFPVISQQIAYGVVTSLNCYDEQVYAFGKGPSMTTVTAPNVGVTTETSITITGTVTDVSAGVSQSEVAKNYPNGLPCVSDESQSKFMEHVYQDQPMRSNATGVSVTISVLDSNNNFRAIGTTTSNVYGTYSLTWTPDIPGDYTVISSFAGSNSYYPSSSATAFHASSPAATPTTTAVPVLNFATTSDLILYIVGATVAIIIAIAIVGILLLRKHP